MNKIVLALLLSIFPNFRSEAQLRVARIFSNHVVLQREKALPVWGWATAGALVTATLNDQVQTTRAGTDGKWMVQFAPMPAGGPYLLDIQSKKERITIKDIMLGEVWICSGQSNMEWNIWSSDNPIEAVQQANYPMIRHYKVARALALQPESELSQESDANWQVCSPKTAGEFTAVGYYFARELHQQLDSNIAIGLVNTAWGGAQIEGWMSKEALLKLPDLQEYAATLPNEWQQADAQLEYKVRKHCLGNPGRIITAADELAYLQPGFDCSDWPQVEAPGAWDWQDIWAFRGTGYMARIIDISAYFAGSAAELFLGENDSPYEVYLNGALIKKGQTDGVITVKIPENRFKTGKNILIIKNGKTITEDWRGMGLHGDTHHLRLDIANESFSLADKYWYAMPAWAEPYIFERLQNNVATTLYNAMLHPLHPVAFRGVLWYQGESNARRAYQYRTAFPALIRDWRRLWSEDFPFLFVQLSSFGDHQSSNMGSEWAELREAQTMALDLPNTGMVVSTDIGNAADIHPKNKKDVGKRLAYNALGKVYGKHIAFESPRFASLTIQPDGSAVIRFSGAENGLLVKDQSGIIQGFEVAAADQLWYPAQAQVLASDSGAVVVFHPEGKTIEAVRYAWSDAPLDANLYNTAGLPLGTFRTDDWPGKTINNKFE